LRIPVIGMGGVQSAAHARELIDVGARLVAVGTESFRDPDAGRRIAQGLQSESCLQTDSSSLREAGRV